MHARIGLRIGLLFFSLLFPVSAFALTAIDTCAELQNMSVNLDGDYLLTDDIDCTGVDFTPVGRDGANFTGTFNGSGYTISNLNIYVGTGAGMFGYTNGATIQNVIIDDATIHGDDEDTNGGVGALIGTAANTNISNIGVTNSTITHSGSFIGGLVGYSAFLTVYRSYVTDTMVIGRGDGVGGLVGGLLSGRIDDSYADATVIAAGDYSGGAVGYMWSIVGDTILKNVYALGSLLALGDFGGGLVGVMDQSTGECEVLHSFAAGDVDGSTVTSLVAAKMNAGCSILNSAFLNHDGNPDECIGIDDGGTTECTEILVEEYFYSYAFEPMASWDFAGIWYERDDTYPGLRWTNAAPAAVTLLSASVSQNDVTLSWTNPPDADFASVSIRRSASSYPTTITDGDAAASGLTGTSYADSDLANGTYYYSIFALDGLESVSPAAQVSATVAVSSSSSSSSSVTPTSGGGGGGRRGSPGRGGTAETLNGPRSINQSHTAAPMTSAQSARETMPVSLKLRTCDRVMKWFRDDAKMLGRVNERLQKRFGFTCGK